MDHAKTSCSVSLLVRWTDMSLQSQEPQLWGMLHWRRFGRDFTTHLLEVLNSSRHRPTTFSNKSGLPSPSRWQRLQPQCVCSVFRSWAFQASFRSTGSLMPLAAIRNALPGPFEIWCPAGLLGHKWPHLRKSLLRIALLKWYCMCSDFIPLSPPAGSECTGAQGSCDEEAFYIYHFVFPTLRN